MQFDNSTTFVDNADHPRTSRHSFAGQTVLITGASSGLGLSLARAFASAQANVVLLARSEVKLATAAQSLGVPANRFLTVATDVSNRDHVNAAVESSVERFGALHIVVSCAGQGVLGLLAEMPIEEVENAFSVNFTGALHLAQATIPKLRAQRGGHIVFISSIFGLRAFPRSAIYSAAKFAVQGLAESLRLELKKDNIHVLTVCPGRLATPFMEHARSIDGKKGLSVEKGLDTNVVATQVLDAIRARKRQLILPFSVRVLHWLNLWCPGLVDRFLLKRFQRDDLL